MRRSACTPSLHTWRLRNHMRDNGEGGNSQPHAMHVIRASFLGCMGRSKRISSHKGVHQDSGH